MENVLPVPPDNFKPLEATADQLEKYGFPQKHTDPVELSNWTSMMQNYKNTASPQTLLLKRSKIVNLHITNSNNVTANTASQYGWAGFYSDEKSSANQWVAVEGTFIQPTEHSGTAQYQSSSVSSRARRRIRYVR